MTKLIELKDKVFKFCAEHEKWLQFVFKFVLALTLFSIINNSIGFMEEISTFPVALVLALICCLLPQRATVIVAAALVLLNLYDLSLEVALTAFIIFVVLFLLYFRFAPKDTVLFILTPILYKLKIPYVLPIGSSLLRNVYSVFAIVCGTISFYFVDGIYQNVTSLASTIVDGEDAATIKFTITVGQLLSNKEMYLMVAVSVLTAIVVYVVRRLSVEHAWKIAIVSGVLVQISGLFAGYLLFSISGKTIAMIFGNIISLVIGFVLEFLFMDLDYERTEQIQFEDDDYYYFVKAVPKKMVTSSEKTVKHFGNTASIGKRVPSSTTKMIKESKKNDIAEELEIDEKLFN
jgi:hypothetical protein